MRGQESIPSNVLKTFPLLSEDSTDRNMQHGIWLKKDTSKFRNESRSHHQTGLRFVIQQEGVNECSMMR